MAWASRAGHRGRAGDRVRHRRGALGPPARLRLLDRRGPTERVVGGCGLHGRLDEHGLEIGYWVHVDRIGQGLATEDEPRAHRRGVRHPRHRAGADPVRRSQRPQRARAREARLRAPGRRACRTRGRARGGRPRSGSSNGPPGSRCATRPPRSLPRVDDRPIGMFDSGFGGLTVARALIDLLPHEHLVYLGDTGRYPYGPRALDEVRGFAEQITDLLVARPRREAPHRRVQHRGRRGSRAPAGARRRPGARRDRAGRAQPGARHPQRPRRRDRHGRHHRLGRLPGGGGDARRRSSSSPARRVPGFVEFVERGETRSDQVAVLAERLLAPVRDAKVDALLLGCTHYPFLARTISDVMGRDVVLVDSADETAFEVRALLEGSALARSADGRAGRAPLAVVRRRRHVPPARSPAPRPGARHRRGRHLAG